MLHDEAAAGVLPGVWSWPLDWRSCHPSFQKAVLKMETQLRVLWCWGAGVGGSLWVGGAVPVCYPLL